MPGDHGSNRSWRPFGARLISKAQREQTSCQMPRFQTPALKLHGVSARPRGAPEAAAPRGSRNFARIALQEPTLPARHNPILSVVSPRLGLLKVSGPVMLGVLTP